MVGGRDLGLMPTNRFKVVPKYITWPCEACQLNSGVAQKQLEARTISVGRSRLLCGLDEKGPDSLSTTGKNFPQSINSGSLAQTSSPLVISGLLFLPQQKIVHHTVSAQVALLFPKGPFGNWGHPATPKASH